MTPRLNWWPIALGIVFVAATAAFAIPGYLTWDSGTYHLMVRGLHETGGFAIPNALDDPPSSLFAVGQTMVRDGVIVSQYPEFYTFLAWPFYALFGYRGLMVLNAIAFVGICFLVFRLARRFSEDRFSASAAVCIYALATYAVEFTQSSYPHLTSTGLICLSVWLLWGALLDNEESPRVRTAWHRTPEWRAAAAGFVFAVAIGVRLDSAFASLAFAVPLLMMRPFKWRLLIAPAVGALPPLLALSWINLEKFGRFFPFYYGKDGSGSTSSLVPYLPVAAICLLFLALIVLHRLRPISLGRRSVVFALSAVVLAVVLSPQGQRLIQGVFQLVVDMRIRPEIPEPGLSRSADGAVVYWNTVKKALLESCPYLILTLLPAVRNLVVPPRPWWWLCWLVPVGFIGFYGYLAWHGSVGWNMRYLNPALPFLAILAAVEFQRLKEYLPLRRPLFWCACGLLWLALVVLFQVSRTSFALQEMVFLNGGLIIAVGLLLLQAFDFTSPGRARQGIRKALAAAFAVSLVWSSALAIGLDYVVGASVRHFFLSASRQIEPLVGPNPLILTFQPNYVWGLLDSGKSPIIARYTSEDTEAVIDLVSRTLPGQPVYWLSPPARSDDISPIVFEALTSRGIGVELLTPDDDSLAYRLFALTR